MVPAADTQDDETPDAEAAAAPLTLLYNISETNSQIVTVKNQPGWFVFNNGGEEFLLTADDPNLKTITGTLVQLEDPVSGLPGELDFMSTAYTGSTIDFANLKFVVSRLTTYTVHELSRRLFSGGIDTLLTLESQLAPELPFSRFYPVGQNQPPGTIIIPDPAQFERLDFNGSYGPYFWEVFFYAPFLTANQLMTRQR
ncbi:MAG: hypothetical protein GY940_21095 [bacterium]|nr:hypothetical protein [bacterium]